MADRTPLGGGDGERRLLTLLFCDLVGSTELAGRLDPEDLREVLRAYQAVCEHAVDREGGAIAHYMGDGILAIFGAPVAREDAPVRAVRAALAMVDAVGSLPAAEDGSRLAARVGVHTGLVVVGAMGSGAAKAELDVVGETPNLTARLQSAAQPGQVLLSDDTAALVGGFIDLEAAGTLRLKGIDRPVVSWLATGATGVADRVDARQRVPLVGRDGELAVVLAACRSAAARSRSQVVVLVGEPGIGKSRLIAEACEAAAAGVVVWRGTPDHLDSPLHPVAEQVRTLAPEEVPAAVAEVLAPPEAASGETPERRRRRTIDALRDWVLARAATPLVLVVDDLHWLDASTVELLRALADQQLAVPLTLLAATRPDREVPFTPAEHVTTVLLDRLGPADVRALIDVVAATTSDELAERIAARAEGVPLFVEEVTRMAATAGLPDGEAVPATLSDLMHARLARVGDDVELARLCSVVGRDVDADLVAAVAGGERAELRVRLKSLVDAGVLARGVDARSFTFRHVLLRDAAYQSLLRSRARELHRRVAETLTASFPAVVARSPEELARHWTAAGALHEAIEAWASAATLAADRFALPESAAHFGRALELVARLEPGADRDRRERGLGMAFGPVAYRLYGGGDERVAQLYHRAEELAVGLTGPERFGVLQGIFGYWSAKPDHDRTGPLGDELVAIAEGSGSTMLRLFASAWRGSDAYLAGDRDSAATYLQRCVELYDPERPALGALDPGVVAWMWLANLDLDAGDVDGALATVGQTQALARAKGQPFIVAWADQHAAKLHALLGDAGTAGPLAEAVQAVAAEQGYAQIEPQMRCVAGWARAATGDAVAGAAEVEAGLAGIAGSGSAADSSLHRLLLVSARRLAGDDDGARRAAEDALAFVAASGERAYEQRIRAELERF